jgi:hypothetical protein
LLEKLQRKIIQKLVGPFTSIAGSPIECSKLLPSRFKLIYENVAEDKG